MDQKRIAALLAGVGVLLLVSATGCLCYMIWNNTGDTGNKGVAGVELTATPVPTQIAHPSTATTGMQVTPTRPAATPGSTVTATQAVTATPVTGTSVAGNIRAELVGYGTDKDTYNRGDTATCYVDIKNTGDVRIDRIDFVVNVYTPRPFIGLYHAIKDQTYTVDQLSIQPGSNRRVELQVEIPASYQGISTAGDYTFKIVVRAGDQDIGNFSKDVKVV